MQRKKPLRSTQSVKSAQPKKTAKPTESKKEFSAEKMRATFKKLIAKNDVTTFKSYFSTPRYRELNITLYGHHCMEEAIKLGKTDIVAYLLDQCQFKLNVINGEGTTYLYTAVQYNQPAIVQQLIKAGASLALEYPPNQTIREQHTVDQLVQAQNNADMTKLFASYKTILQIELQKFLKASIHHDFKSAVSLYDRAKDPGKKYQQLFFMALVKEGHLDTIKHFIKLNQEKKLDLDFKMTNDKGSDLVLIAAEAGQTGVLKALVRECKMDPHSRQPFTKHTPLYLAISNGHTDTARYLIEECEANLMLVFGPTDFYGYKIDKPHTVFELAVLFEFTDIQAILNNKLKTAVSQLNQPAMKLLTDAAETKRMNATVASKVTPEQVERAIAEFESHVRLQFNYLTNAFRQQTEKSISQQIQHEKERLAEFERSLLTKMSKDVEEAISQLTALQVFENDDAEILKDNVRKKYFNEYQATMTQFRAQSEEHIKTIAFTANQELHRFIGAETQKAYSACERFKKDQQARLESEPMFRTKHVLFQSAGAGLAVVPATQVDVEKPSHGPA